MTRDQRHEVARIAARQHGVVSVWQLRAIGIDKKMVAREVRAGHLHPVHRGVYAVGHPGLTDLGRAMAAVLSCGRGAVLSHRSASVLWGMRSYRGWPEVTVRRTGARHKRGVRVHTSTSLEAHEVTELHGIPVTTPERTVVDLADVLTPSAHQQAVAAAERAGLVDRTQLPHAPGRRAVAGAHVFTRSQFERRFRAAVERWGLPLPEMNQELLGWEVDALWRDRRLVVELDHPHTHLNPRSFETDRLKQEQLEDAGIRVRRVTEQRFRERPQEVRSVLIRWLGLQAG